MNNSWKEEAILAWKGWGCSLFIAALIATSFKSTIADWNIVPTGSMKPTIVDGDRIFVNKLAHDPKISYTTRHLLEWDHPGRGDVVVFTRPWTNGVWSNGSSVCPGTGSSLCATRGTLFYPAALISL